MRVSSNWKALQAKIKPKHTSKVTKVASSNTTSLVETASSKEITDSWFEIKSTSTSLPITPASSRIQSLFNQYPRSENASDKIGKYVAIDCEMVGVGDGTESVLARVSIVNYHGHVVLDTYVKTKENVKDYRTHVSGIEAKHLRDGELFENVQKKVAEILDGRVLIGHAVYNDLSVLLLSHPTTMIRDTSKYGPFKKHAKGRTPGLKKLAFCELNVQIQEGQHCSVQDAQVAMLLYRKVREYWEPKMKERTHRHIRKTKKKKEKLETKQ